MFSNCCLMQKYSYFSLIRAYPSHLQKPRAVNPALAGTCYLWNKWKGREGRGVARGSPCLGGHTQARGGVRCPGRCSGTRRVWVGSGNGKIEEKQQNDCNELKLGKIGHLLCMFGGLSLEVLSPCRCWDSSLVS